MKKHWLLTLGIYCLGVATVPGLLVGARWWRNSAPTTTKFVDLQNSEVVTAASLDQLDPGEAEFKAPAPSKAPSEVVAKVDDKPFADEGLAESNSTESAPKKKSAPMDLDLEFSPPVLAQNPPSRKPAAVRESFDEFEAPAFQPSNGHEPARAKPRTTPETAKPEPPDGIESLVEAELSDEQKAKLTTLREKLAELTKAKAELVNEQTLEETIFSLEKQISNLHAAQKLLSAQQILRALAEEFPDSPAAAKAQRMLEAAEAKKSLRTSSDPRELGALPTYR